MTFVGDVGRSIEFYSRLGFAVGNTQAPEGAIEPVWAWLQCGGAQLMLARASHSVDPEAQGVLFYLYVPDVAAFRAELVAGGLEAGEIKYPFYAPRGEFALTDPDGYALMITHT
jgi:hypothetical protein